MSFLFFFFNDTATTEIYTLSLHDALPIFGLGYLFMLAILWSFRGANAHKAHRGFRYAQIVSSATMALGHGMQDAQKTMGRSEEHTSELQSRQYLVCRLLLEKKKNDIPRQ